MLFFFIFLNLFVFAFVFAFAWTFLSIGLSLSLPSSLSSPSKEELALVTFVSVSVSVSLPSSLMFCYYFLRLYYCHSHSSFINITEFKCDRYEYAKSLGISSLSMESSSSSVWNSSSNSRQRINNQIHTSTHKHTRCTVSLLHYTLHTAITVFCFAVCCHFWKFRNSKFRFRSFEVPDCPFWKMPGLGFRK